MLAAVLGGCVAVTMTKFSTLLRMFVNLKMAQFIYTYVASPENFYMLSMTPPLFTVLP